jgi:hypothetical protein
MVSSGVIINEFCVMKHNNNNVTICYVNKITIIQI